MHYRGYNLNFGGFKGAAGSLVWSFGHRFGGFKGWLDGLSWVGELILGALSDPTEP